QPGVLGQQQVGGGVRVGLLEAARRGHAGDGAAGGVQVGGGAQAVGHRVAEAGRGLRVAEDDRPAGRPAQQLSDPAAEGDAVLVHDGRRPGHVLAEHLGHQQVGPLGVAPQGQAQQAGQRVVADEFDAEPLGDPGAGPDVLAGPRRVTHPVVHPLVHCLLHGFLRLGSGARRAARRGGGVVRPVHFVRPAASSSTKPMSSFATPKTSARSRVRSAQARCGFTSFILFVYADLMTPPPPLSGRRMSWASLYSSWLTTDSACTGRTWEGWMQVLPRRPLAWSREISRSSPSMECLMSFSRSATACCSRKGLCRSCGLNMRSWTRKHSQTGPVTVKPVPSARASMLTTSAMTEATTWMS